MTHTLTDRHRATRDPGRYVKKPRPEGVAMRLRTHPCAHCHRNFLTFGGLMRHLLREHRPAVEAARR